MPLYYTGPLNYNHLYKWVCHGENCPECQSLEGEVKTLDQWEVTVMPGFHPGCDCSLVAAALTENGTTRFFARILNWMLDAGMFSHIFTNAPYSSMYKIFSTRFLAGVTRRKEEEDDDSSVRTYRPGQGNYTSGGSGRSTMGGTRRTFSRTRSCDFTSTSFTQPSQTVLSLDGAITAPRYLNPRFTIPHPDNILASNRA